MKLPDLRQKFLNNFWCVPCSIISPFCKTIILSACWMVESRWATTSIVPIFLIFSSEFWIIDSVSVSIFDVASSRMSIWGLWTTHLAKDNNCLWPAEKFSPLSMTSSSYLFGSFSMKLLALTYSQAYLTSSSLIDSSWRVIFVLIDPIDNLF